MHAQDLDVGSPNSHLAKRVVGYLAHDQTLNASKSGVGSASTANAQNSEPLKMPQHCEGRRLEARVDLAGSPTRGLLSSANYLIFCANIA